MIRFHRWFGIVLTVIFLGTGQYMRFVAHVSALEMGPRLLYRTRHIYILMAALINLTLGAYAITSHARGARLLQRIASVLIIAGSMLLIVSFFYDPAHADLVPLDLIYSKWGIRAVAAGTALHAIGAALRSRAATVEHVTVAATSASGIASRQ